MQVSYQPFIKKHSYLDNWYHAWLASTGQFQTHRYIPKGGTRGQNLGDLQIFFGGDACLKEVFMLNNRYY